MLQAGLTQNVNIQQQQRRGLKYEPIKAEHKIEMGHKMTQVVEKKRLNYVKRREQTDKYSNVNVKPTRRLLIACSNPVFNHYTGQAYKNFSERDLASFGWKNRHSAGRYFTVNPINTGGSHPSLIDSSRLRNEHDSVIEFADLYLNPTLIDRLARLNILRPTYVQYLSMQRILSRQKHFMLIAETGGGKTLSYGAPMIEFAIRLKHLIERLNLKRDLHHPIGVVLVPTRELAYQVYKFFNQLITSPTDLDSTSIPEEQRSYVDYLNNLNVVIDLHPGQIKAKEIVTNEKLNSLENAQKPVDILITLPGQLEDRLAKNQLNSAYLRQFVVDEADTLLDDSFSRVTMKCLNKLKLNLLLPQVDENLLTNGEEESNDEKMIKFYLSLDERLRDPSVQLIFSSATVPSELRRFLENLVNMETQMETIKTNKINRLMLHVPQKFIRTNGKKRPELLLELVKKELDRKHTQRTLMIFCYRSKTALYVAKYLKENNVDCELLTKALTNRQREAVVSRFFNQHVRVLCCTDIASRGWDTVHVNHVINFEMPQYIADYLHRVGRVGRLNYAKNNGSNGLVTNFIVNRFDAELVMNIEKSLRLGNELDNVNANIKRLYKNSYMLDDEREEVKQVKLDDDEEDAEENFHERPFDEPEESSQHMNQSNPTDIVQKNAQNEQESNTIPSTSRRASRSQRNNLT